MKGDLSVSIAFQFGTKWRRDLLSQPKLLIDSLTGIVYDADSQIVELHRRYDSHKQRVLKEVNKLDALA